MAKKGFLDGYKTYNPEVDGYGNSEQWKRAFNDRMGYKEAVEYLHDENPYSILGLRIGCSLSDIKKAFRKLIMKYHPDVNKELNADLMSKKIIAAYSILCEKID